MEITNIYDLPKPFVELARENKHRTEQDHISVTQLLGGVCKYELEKRHDNELKADCSDMANLIFGSAVHKILEEEKCGIFEQQELFMTHDYGDGKKLCGTCDLIAFLRATITDYKTVSIWKVLNNDWDDYEKQLKCYCLLAYHNGVKPFADYFHGEIVAFIKDFSPAESKRNADYPVAPIVKISYKWTLDELLDFERDFVIPKLESFVRARIVPEHLLAPCSEKERWQRPGKFAVMKKGRKSAVKLFDNEKDANDFADTKGDNHYVEERPTINMKCDNYCNVNVFCPFYRNVGGDCL